MRMIPTPAQFRMISPSPISFCWQSNLAKIYIDVYEYCDLTTLMKYTKQMKNNGVTFNEETENYFVYIDKILATK